MQQGISRGGIKDKMSNRIFNNESIREEFRDKLKEIKNDKNI